MEPQNSAFLDTSTLFSGIWSSSGGARMILKLGEAGAVKLLVSSQVLEELEGVLNKKAPDLVGMLALLLERSGIQVVPSPPKKVLVECMTLVKFPGDAKILAAAWAGKAGYFITLDKKHFLANTALKKVVPFPIGTPGDYISWFRNSLS